jgi:hypothetical protein
VAGRVRGDLEADNLRQAGPDPWAIAKLVIGMAAAITSGDRVPVRVFG